MSLCACSRLFQKLSAAIKALISPRRLWAEGTSKKPPQMGQFIGGGGQLGCNRVKHQAQCKSPGGCLQVMGVNPNPRLRKGFKPRNTRSTRKNGTLPRISRIPQFSRLSILATCLNPQHFAPSCRGQPSLGEDSEPVNNRSFSLDLL